MRVVVVLVVGVSLIAAGCSGGGGRVSAFEHGCNFVTTAWHAFRQPAPPVAEAVSLAHIARLADELIEPATEFRDAALAMAGDATVSELYGSESPAPDVSRRDALERMEVALDELVGICEDAGMGLDSDLGGPGGEQRREPPGDEESAPAAGSLLGP